ncbi:hypothetical protein DFJ77DRAFT_506181 [Powellomyces hirtus]|nr:hypothetical protein DFJ77DRAFT_506181 [Powellomyces hirtus]
MTNPMDSDNILLQAQNLLSNGLHSSAELLLGYLLSTIPSKQQDRGSLILYCKASALLADAYAELGQDQRALRLYDTAFRAFSSNQQILGEDRVFLYGVKEKQSLCYRRLGQLGEAIAELEKIPIDALGVKSCLTLATWYEETRSFNQAREAYLNVLRKEPLATEAMMGAIRYGAEIEDMLPCFPPTPAGEWTKHFVWSYFAGRRHRYAEALERLGELQRVTPLNNEVMLAMADCYYKSGDSMKAHYQYRQLMRREQDTIKQMDRYAHLLKMRGQREALNQHATALSRKNPNQPEAWLAMASFRQMQGDLENALHFVEKALSCNRRYSESWLMKGSLLMASGRLQEALPAFRAALGYEETILGYEGIVECYLLQSRIVDAHLMAKAVAGKMHQLPKARILVGAVLKARGDADSRRKARCAFEEAYRMNTLCTEAVLALVTALEEESEYERAIDLLKAHSGHIQIATLHYRLGEIYVRLSQYEDAMDQYNTALRIDSQYEPATKGIQKLHRILGSGGDGEEFPGSDDEELEEDGEVDELSNGEE